MEERKFVCKYCNKRFSCGKSLGGHIRTHMSGAHNHHHHSSARANNAASSGGMTKFDAVRKRDFLGSEDGADDVDDDDVDGEGNSLIYGLRENPKKTMRFVHTNATLQLKFCKECGKGFPSLKALCGHMACHSEKEKPTTITNNNYRFANNNNNNNNISSGISEKQKLVMDSQSDTETSAPRRSKRMMKFKTLTNSSNKSATAAAAANANVAFGNGSSSVSEVEHEQEEVARCLMMLSKDNNHHHKGPFALLTESSDNNSVVLEAKSKSKSPSVCTKFAFPAAAINNGNVKDSVSNGYGVVENKLNKYKQRDMKKLKCDKIDYDSDNSDSGYFRYGPKKVDSDDSSEEVMPSREVFRDYDVGSKKIILSREGGRNRNNTVFKKLVLDDSAKRKQSYNASIGVSSKKTSKNPNGFANEKVWKYEYLKSERDNNNNNYKDGSDYDSAYESDENSTDTDTESYPAAKAQSDSIRPGAKKSGKGNKKKPKLKLKKSKEHECPICNKIFRSGQALGGHKRSHFVGGSEENTLVIRPSAPNHPVATSVIVPCLIDLNLPAPVDE